MRFIAAVLIGLVFMGSAETKTASAKATRQYTKQVKAIETVFCKGKPPCELGNEALVVAKLEGGMYHWIRGTCKNAINGEYRGCFQMGSRERRLYGHGPGTWAQARAAYRYYKKRGGWGPWSCKPQGYCLS